MTREEIHALSHEERDALFEELSRTIPIRMEELAIDALTSWDVVFGLRLLFASARLRAIFLAIRVHRWWRS